MTIGEFPSDVDVFLRRFFGPGNQISWQDIKGDVLNQATIDFLAPWLEDIKRRDRSILLPRLVSKTRVDWYAFAFTPAQSRLLRQHLQSFIGPTYTSFDARLANLDLNDPVEKAIHEFVGNSVFRFTVLEGKNDKVRESIIMMRTLWEESPNKALEIVRSLESILKDFEMSLRYLDEKWTQQLLVELGEGGRLNAQNLLFLTVRYLGTYKKWLEVISIPEFQTMLSMPRPRLVTQVLIQAIYNVYLNSFEKDNNAKNAIEYFSKSLMPKFGNLFFSRAGMNAPEVSKSFMMLAASTDPPRTVLKESILSDYPVDSQDRTYLEKLSSFVAPQQHTIELNPFEQARSAYERRDYDQAFSCLLSCDRSTEAIEMMLVCAHEIRSLASTSHVLDALENADEQVRANVLKVRIYSQIFNELTSVSLEDFSISRARRIPESWVDWLSKLNESGVWPEAVDMAQKGVIEWRIVSATERETFCQLMVQLLMVERDPDASRVLRNSLPFLLESFLPDGFPHPEFQELYENLILLIAIDDCVATGELNALEELTGALLEIGLAGKHAAELMKTLTEVWQRIQSPRHFDWALNILDLIVTYPSMGEASVDKFVSSVLASASKMFRRLNKSQIILLGICCEYLGKPDIFKEFDYDHPIKPDIFHDSFSVAVKEMLNGQTIAIYTLMEQVGSRIHKALTSLYPYSHIQLNHEYAGSKKLASLSRQAEIFVIAVQSAKHAATEYIISNRPPHKTTLVTKSRGCSGMLREIMCCIEAMAEKRLQLGDAA